MMKAAPPLLLLSLLLLSSCWLPPCAAFVPNRFLAVVLKAASLDFDATFTHGDMTRAAILEVAAEVLTDNPEDQGSAGRIAALTTLTEEDLITAYYGERRRSETRSFSDAIDDINDANSDVDLGEEQELAAAHFDSEQFQAGQNRLVELRLSTLTHIAMENYEMARMETGRMFHALQDFYSHSNWIENGNTRPYNVLGRDGERPQNIASPTTQTCTNCREDGTFFVGAFLDIFTDTSSTIYSCPDNLVEELSEGGILTSGYADGQRDVEGREIEKPPGKCSHGGFLDPSADTFAKGGINKDSSVEVWSPRHFLYETAANLAQEATADILREMRLDVDDDQRFSAYLGLNVPEAISIAYVIDTTESMREELLQIQATIPAIRTNLEQYVESFGASMSVNYILVPFNDPGTQL